MGIRAISPTGVLLPVAGLWLLDVEVRDIEDCDLADVIPTVVVTPPAGETAAPTFTRTSTGRYRATYTVAAPGRYVAAVTATDLGVVEFAAYAAGATTAAGMPGVEDVAAYLREDAASWETEELQNALDAETDAQRSVCRIRAVYPADMREALLRRVQRNLAMRALPLAVLQGDAGADNGGGILPGRDPEVRRLEAPHRKTPIG